MVVLKVPSSGLKYMMKKLRAVMTTEKASKANAFFLVGNSVRGVVVVKKYKTEPNWTIHLKPILANKYHGQGRSSMYMVNKVIKTITNYEM